MSLGDPLGIAGVGLIGGSIALRARAEGVRVIGYDREAIPAGIVDATCASMEALARESATLVVALPLDATLDAIDALRRGDDRNLALVLDVASVKEPVVRRAAGWARFAATHPIAGAERGGAVQARADLFAGRAWAYVPGANDEAVVDFIRFMGATPVAVDARTHDEALALTSHLPQVVVAALGALLDERQARPDLAGPGLASTLRLAGSSWALWETILRANAGVLSGSLRDLAERLSAAARDLEEGELSHIPSYFEGANRAYEHFVRERST